MRVLAALLLAFRLLVEVLSEVEWGQVVQALVQGRIPSIPGNGVAGTERIHLTGACDRRGHLLVRNLARCVIERNPVDRMWAGR